MMMMSISDQHVAMVPSPPQPAPSSIELVEHVNSLVEQSTCDTVMRAAHETAEKVFSKRLVQENSVSVCLKEEAVNNDVSEKFSNESDDMEIEIFKPTIDYSRKKLLFFIHILIKLFSLLNFF